MGLHVGGRIRAHCNQCSAKTWHKVLHQEFRYDADSDPGVPEGHAYYMLECQGCDRVMLRVDWLLGELDGVDDAPTYYPSPLFRKEPVWLIRWWLTSRSLHSPTARICREVYSALQNDQPHLAAMGVRAVLEQVMIDKIGGDKRTFANNLDELCKMGHVSHLMRERLANVLDVGSATIHRGHTPSSEDLTSLVNVMEHVLESLYVQEDAVRRMAERVTPRPPKPAK